MFVLSLAALMGLGLVAEALAQEAKPAGGQGGAPSARKPATLAEALAGKWAGKMTVVDPGQKKLAKPGDYELSLVLDGIWKATSGKALGFNIVEGAQKAFDPKTRGIEFILSYQVGGSMKFPLVFKGAFSEDWSTIKGTWSSSYVGSGTFEIAWGGKG